jgi:hypothetical protein
MTPKGQKLNVQSIRNSPVSSSSAKLSSLKNSLCGRPESRPGIPIGLYHPVFASFEASFNDASTEISSQQIRSSMELMAASTRVYKDEKSRSEAVKPCLEKVLQSELLVVVKPQSKADGVMTTGVAGRTVAFRVIWELKNDVGSGSDPVTQASYAYRKFLGSKDVCNQLIHPLHSPAHLLVFRKTYSAIPVAVLASLSLSLAHIFAFSAQYLWRRL